MVGTYSVSTQICQSPPKSATSRSARSGVSSPCSGGFGREPPKDVGQHLVAKLQPVLRLGHLGLARGKLPDRLLDSVQPRPRPAHCSTSAFARTHAGMSGRRPEGTDPPGRGNRPPGHLRLRSPPVLILLAAPALRA